MTTPPPERKSAYNRHLDGVYGEFGAGAGVQAFYIQSAITPRELDWVSLISEIQGSERWPVRDLFQRDVDNVRITDSLLPYLEEAEKIKFFNPLTLTVLPMDEKGTKVLTQMPRVKEYPMEDRDRNWNCLERTNYFRVRWIKDSPQYAELEWSDTQSRLVAIDGQHRLSALKRFLLEEEHPSHDDFMKWRIPVVIVSFRAGQKSAEPPSVLEVIRNIFVYINTEAKEVNAARKILLSDESVNDVCTQELLERSHRNDLKPQSKREPHCLPLLFYDWRGEESEKRKKHSPAAVKSVEEIQSWFRYYLLGEDFSKTKEQETALGIEPIHPLHEAFHDRKLSHKHSKELRILVNIELLPGLAYVLENFVPYRSYTSDLRKLEKNYESAKQSDLARHAFHDLRFGTNYANISIKEEVNIQLEEIKKHIEESKKKHIRSPIDLEIGMRGVISAFGYLHRFMGNRNWIDHAIRFTKSLNQVYEDGWLDLTEQAKKWKRDSLLHIAEDHTGDIVNYRLEQVENALGTYVALLVICYDKMEPELSDHQWQSLRRELLEKLENTIIRGYRKQVRPELREEYPGGGRELTEAVDRKARQMAAKQIRRLERNLDQITIAAKNI